VRGSGWPYAAGCGKCAAESVAWVIDDGTLGFETLLA
jgi:hypothetical protein